MDAFTIIVASAGIVLGLLLEWLSSVLLGFQRLLDAVIDRAMDAERTRRQP